MAKNISIRWFSRAGQGAITAATALAQILGKNGKFVQVFPDFGAEKRGAAVVVFNRISSEKLTNVAHPRGVDIVVLLDTSLVASGEISKEKLLEGLNPDGKLLVNTGQGNLKIAQDLKNVFTVKASEIAVETIGKDIPNVPILGALVKIGEFLDLEKFQAGLRNFLGNHLPPEILEGNLKAFEKGYNEISKL
jgi:pyruvate ferredoxin oxidoreductase gamma subunit